MSFPSGRHLVLLGTLQLLVIWALAFVLASRADTLDREPPRAQEPIAWSEPAAPADRVATPHGTDPLFGAPTGAAPTLGDVARERSRGAECPALEAERCPARPRGLP